VVSGDVDSEKKRKRRDGSLRSSEVSPISNVTANPIQSSPKRYKNIDADLDGISDDASKKLPRSIESLYASIWSAQEELEAGRSWSENA
jgi:hypothetical protein